MKLTNLQIALAAIADPTRLRIMNLLQEGELCVCDVMSVLKEPQSKVSRHLGYLRKSGLVEARKQGLWMYYRLAKPSGKTIQGVFEALKLAQNDCEELKEDLRQFNRSKSCLVACCK